MAQIKQIYIYDVIDPYWGISAEWIKYQINGLTADDTIEVHVNSPGGSVTEGITIYNLLKNAAPSVVMHIDGLAASIASIISLAGDEVIGQEGSLFMIHNPWMYTGGDSEELRKDADLLDKIKEQLVNIYVGKTGIDKDKIIDAMNNETWYSASEAMDAGFYTSVVEPKQIAASAIKSYDFKAMGFSKVPKSQGENKNIIQRLLSKSSQDKDKNMNSQELKNKYPDAVAELIAEGEKVHSDAKNAESERINKINALKNVSDKIKLEGVINGLSAGDVAIKALEEKEQQGVETQNKNETTLVNMKNESVDTDAGPSVEDDADHESVMAAVEAGKKIAEAENKKRNF